MTLHRQYDVPGESQITAEKHNDEPESLFTMRSRINIHSDPTVPLARTLRHELKNFCSLTCNLEEPRIGFLQPTSQSFDVKNIVSSAQKLSALVETLSEEMLCESPEYSALKQVYQECHSLTASLVENTKQEKLSTSKAIALRDQLPEMIQKLLKYELVCETIQTQIAEAAQRNLDEIDRRYLLFFSQREVIRA